MASNGTRFSCFSLRADLQRFNEIVVTLQCGLNDNILERQQVGDRSI